MNTVIISASVALIIFSLTQWLTARRARTDRLTQKLEEYFVLMCDFRDAAIIRFRLAANSDIEGTRNKQDQITDSISTLRSKSLMYVNLYFPRLEDRWLSVVEVDIDILDIVPKVEAVTGKNLKTLEKSTMELCKRTQDMMKFMSENQRLLTKHLREQLGCSWQKAGYGD